VQVPGRDGHGGNDASAQQRGVAALEHGAAGNGCSVPPTMWPSAASPLSQPSVRLAWPWREARGKLVPVCVVSCNCGQERMYIWSLEPKVLAIIDWEKKRLIMSSRGNSLAKREMKIQFICYINAFFLLSRRKIPSLF